MGAGGLPIGSMPAGRPWCVCIAFLCCQQARTAMVAVFSLAPRSVPMADATLAHAPADVSDEEALLLGDIFSTGFFCADSAGIAALAASSAGGGGGGGEGSAPVVAAAAEGSAAAPAADEGPVVAVVGCGPVGLLAIIGEPRLLLQLAPSCSAARC